MEQSQVQNKDQQIPQPRVATPNERTGLNVDEFVKIFDPENQQIFLEKRG